MNTTEEFVCSNCGCDYCAESRCLNAPTEYYNDVCVEFEE